MSVEPTPTVPQSANGNGLFAVIMAMAASDDAGVDATNLANNDLSTSEFMKRMFQLLGQFHGNMKAIQSFLKSYVANHEAGSAARERLTTDSVLSLQALSTMADKIGDFETQIADAQKKVDDAGAQIKDYSDQIKSLKDELGDGFGQWFSYYLERGGFLCPAVAAALAGEKCAAIGQDISNLTDKITAVTKDLNNAQTQLSGLQASEMGLVEGTTGRLNTRSSALADPAKSMIQTANQAATLSFLFVEALNDLVAQNQ
jgi:cell division protein FtsL